MLNDIINWEGLNCDNHLMKHLTNILNPICKVLVWLELFRPPPPDEPGFKRGLNTSFNTNIC